MEINIKANKYDNDIIKTQSYKIIQDNSIQRNFNSKKNNLNYNISNNNYNSNNFDNDEDKNINLNININNYLSKKDININSNAPINNFQYALNNQQNRNILQKYNTELTQGYLIRHLNKQNYNRNNNQKYSKEYNNYNNNNIRETKKELKSQLLSRLNKQKFGTNNIDLKKININTKKGVVESNYNIKEKPKEKEQVRQVPKILTFLQTFKNMALPLKIDKNKKKEMKNKIEDKNIKQGGNDINKDNNSKYNFNYRPLMKKPEINKNIKENWKNEENNEDNNDEECIDYNRFTFRNSGDENSPFKRRKKDKKIRIKNKEVEEPQYNEESSDNDINKNINIDAYNRKYNNKNRIIHSKYRHKNIPNNYYKNKANKNSEEISPDFKEYKNNQINIIPKKINEKKSPYLRKNILIDQYTSPRPLPKNEIKSKYIKDNISEKNDSKYYNDYRDFDNESDNSFRSYNPSKIYRKQILNNSFQISDNVNQSYNNSYYYNNNMSSDQNNLEHNYYTINRPNKKKKINEILININDSEDYSFNSEQNFYTKSNIRLNRSPINRKENNNNNLLLNRSPLSSKQINNNQYEYSDFYDSQAEEENNIKKNTNYARFMQPFGKKYNKGGYNEDSYLSYDIENMNKKHLYNKPFKKVNISRQMNKNNSMYLKPVVHYENKKNSFFNESNSSFWNKKNKNEFSDYDEINNNVYDFDAPKSVHDLLDDKFSSTSSINMNESARDNKFSTNTALQSDRSKKDNLNININQNLSFRDEEKPKMVYSKKLNTMYNFYQGTKKFFSNINNKVFKFIKKDDKNNNNNINNIENDKKNNLIYNKGVMTPRIINENENENNNNNIFYNKNYTITPTGFDNKSKTIKDNMIIKEKVKFKNKCFYNKFYHYYLKSTKNPDIGFYFSYQKVIKIKPKKKKINIPDSFLRYFKKGRIKNTKIPLINKCYFNKFYIYKVNKKFKEEIKNIEKNKLKCDNQVNIIISKKPNQIINNESKDKNILFFNNDKNTFENQNIKPDNIWSVSFLKSKNPEKSNIKKYQYEYIIALKNDKSCLNDNLLPKNLLDHFKLLNETKEIYNYKLIDENELRKKFKKREMLQIINRYAKQNKIQQSNKIENIKDDKQWPRNDFTKETEQAEKYIKELNKKMEENNEQNNIIGMLNILTMDNLNDVLNKIIYLITRNKDNFILSDEEIIKNIYILVKAIVSKAILETRFVNLYAKLSSELNLKLNNVSFNSENFKTIIIDECKNKFDEINKNENIFKNKFLSFDDETIILIKKSFIGNIDFISELINNNLFSEEIGFYYLEELNKIYNNTSNSAQINKIKKNIALEATVNFLSKFGKKIFSDKNIQNISKLNNFINSNLKSILDNKDLSGFLKYKIINLIEKQKNKWKDSLYEQSILAKGKLNNKDTQKNKKTRKRRHSNKSLKNMNQNNTISNNYNKENSFSNENKSVNSSTINYNPHLYLKLNTSNSTSYMDEEITKLIEQDIIKYKIFFNENKINNKLDLSKNIQIGNEFDWTSIEEILSQNKINLSEIIRCYIEVCIDEILDSTKIFIYNDYIKNIICYYSEELTTKERDIIHNKIINLFLNIRDICIDNNYMKEIMGFLMFILIEKKLYFIKDLNNFLGKEKDIIITIAEVIKYAIISSEEKCKKYHNDFKQTKLFVNNSIFAENVTNIIEDMLK